MENETFENNLEDEYADNLSNIPSDVEDNEDSDSDGVIENVIHPAEEDNSDDNSDDSFQQTRRDPDEFHTPSSTDSVESDDDDDIDWSNIDSLRTNEPFQGSTGPRIVPNNKDKVEEIVNFFMGDDFLEFIAVETNKYSAQDCRNRKITDVTVAELKKWFALVILMGLIRKAKINDYWSTNPLLETPIFSKTMSRDRFRQILRCLHFSDNDNLPPNANRLFKVQHLIDYFSKKFKENFNPGQNISINESVIPWRGRSNSYVYNPSKIKRYGILVRMACDSVTGYILNFNMYSGLGQKIEKTGWVLDLLNDYSNKWHHLYMDNLCNSVELPRRLLLNKIRVCGSIKVHQGLPKYLKKAKLKVMETKFARKGEILLQLYKTNERRDIIMVTTIHDPYIVDTGKRDRRTGNAIQKPQCIMDYNLYMKGVDRADKFLSYFDPIFRKTKKWTKKVLLYLINCALFNAFRVYENLNTDSARKITIHDFLLNLAMAWIKNNNPSTSRGTRIDPIQRLSGELKHHQLVKISETRKGVRRRCRVCYANKIIKATYFWCKSCQVPLHVGDCFTNYHTKKKY